MTWEPEVRRSPGKRGMRARAVLKPKTSKKELKVTESSGPAHFLSVKCSSLGSSSCGPEFLGH